MKFAAADAALAGIPYTGSRKGRFFYDFIVSNGVRHVLELGFAHGASTCYMAAALEETDGAIDTVDLDASAGFDPTIEQLGERVGVSSIISVHREASSYTWWLKRKIEQQTKEGVCDPLYDLVFVDGPKDWTNDGAAFFMADKLLRPGGWMMFDDYSWTYRGHERASGFRYERGYIFDRMSEEEFAQAHVEAIFRLLVQQHPSYSAFEVVDDTIAVARKIAASAPARKVALKTSLTPSYMLFSALKRAKHLMR